MLDRPAETAFANFIICGVPKAGTSSLHRWIADHPDAAGSIEKETYFFADPGTHMFRDDMNAGQGLHRYAEHFALGAEQARVRIESTPAYIYYARALEHVPQLPGKPKCLFVVREPAAQIYSLYRYFRSNWAWIPSSMSFRSYIATLHEGRAGFGGNELARDALRNAAYVDFLMPWRERLGCERMRVMLFENLQRDPAGFAAEVARWIGLDPAFYESYDFPRENDTYAVRSTRLQRLNIAMRARLPRGRAYAALRAAYRAFNTRAPDGPSEDDRATIAELRGQFCAANLRLSRAFGLDLSHW